MGRKAQLLFGTAALWVAAAAPASAQDRAPEALPADTAAEAGDDGAIVVTARRREERLSDVPTAASVIDATALNDRGGMGPRLLIAVARREAANCSRTSRVSVSTI